MKQLLIFKSVLLLIFPVVIIKFVILSYISLIYTFIILVQNSQCLYVREYIHLYIVVYICIRKLNLIPIHYTVTVPENIG